MKSILLFFLGPCFYAISMMANVAAPTPAPAKVETVAKPAVEVPAKKTEVNAQAGKNVPVEVKTEPVPAPVQPVAAKPAVAEENKNYDPKQFYGVAILGADKKLNFVAENPSQTHGNDRCAMIKVTGITMQDVQEKGRIRVAVWDSEGTYAKEGVKPFRASSFEGKQAANGEMKFRICGLEIGKEYSFFVHVDKTEAGKVVKNWLGIPKDQFIFSSKKTQGKGAGLSREGFSAPKFQNTLVKFTANGQEILLPL